MTESEFRALEAQQNAKISRSKSGKRVGQNSGSSVLASDTQKKKVSKHRNTLTKYKGIMYHSKREAEYAAWLDIELKAGRILAWERQPKFLLLRMREHTSFVVNQEIFKYTADFLIHNLDGSRHVVDIKGYDKQRDKDVRAQWATFGPYPLHVIYTDHTIIVPAAKTC